MTTDNANLDGGGNGDQNNGGASAPAWTAQLDKDLQGNERLTSFKTIGEMGKAFLDLEGKSKDALFIPGENATDTDRAAFYARLGRPEAAEKYTFTKPADLPADVPYSPEVETAFKQFAFQKGLSDSQATELHNWYWDLAKQGVAQEQQATEQAVNSLKDEWKGDAFKVNTELAVRAFKKFGGEQAEAFINEKRVDGVPLGNHPAFLKVFAAIGKAMGNDSMGPSGTMGGELSDEDKAKARFPNTYTQGG